MRTTPIPQAARGIGAAALLTFLFIQQRPVDLVQYRRFTDDLQVMRQLDAEINEDLLSSRYELLNSYDPFVEKLGRMRKTAADLLRIPEFVNGKDREQVGVLITAESKTVMEKTRYVDRFKSDNAVLKNSLRYFPSLIAEGTRAALKSNDGELREHLATLLRDILLYDLTPHSDLNVALTGEINLLSEDAARRPDLSALLGALKAHALTITAFKPKVEALTRQLVSQPDARNIDAISRTCYADYERASRAGETYRMVLYLCSVALLFYCIDRAMNLVKFRLAVARARASTEIAEQANRAKSAFLATMSHELRTPLNAILGFSELLQMEMADEGVTKWEREMQNIQRSGRHLLALINDILDLSKIDAGKVEIASEDFQLGDVLEDVTASLRPQAAKNGNTIQVVYAPAVVRGDMMRVQQCLLNLAGNACKFTHDGSIRIEANIENSADISWCQIAVIDTGIGISPDRVDSLFREFQQVDSSTTRKYGGTGLGLAISRRLCQKMGDDITVVSKAGQGSTFTMRFPSAGCNSNKEIRQAAPGPAACAAVSG